MDSCQDTDIDQVYPYEMHTWKWFNRGLKEIKHCIVFSLLFSMTGPLDSHHLATDHVLKISR